MPTGYTFPRKQCPVCKQMISTVQFFRHEGSKACAEVARLKAKCALTEAMSAFAYKLVKK